MLRRLMALTIVACTSVLAWAKEPVRHTKDSLETVQQNLTENKAILLDVREPEEWQEGHLKTAKLMPLTQMRDEGKLKEFLRKLAKDKIIYTHCGAGVRAVFAATILKQQGFEVRPLKPGYKALVKAGFTKADAAEADTTEPCISGVPVGRRPGPYIFTVATGEQRGQPTCYICETGPSPAFVVFARKTSKPLGKLLNQLDPVVEPDITKDGIRGWVTFLDNNKFDIDTLAKWGQEQAVKNIPLGVFDDPIGPPSYLLNEEAEVTVLLFVNEKVVANFAFRPGELDETKVKQILKTVPKLK